MSVAKGYLSVTLIPIFILDESIGEVAADKKSSAL
jgi:hypothetical protein